jgi:hypothetical protein
MKFTILSIFIISFSAHSQEQINNNDLRHVNKVISISEGKSIYEFSKNKLDQLFYESKVGSKFLKKKIDKNEFKKIDDDFVNDFINLKYMMSATPKKCKISHTLFMRGEYLNICSSEKKKIEKIKILISKINQIK